MSDNPKAFSGPTKELGGFTTFQEGMTLLDYFAGQALAGSVTGSRYMDFHERLNLTKQCYDFAQEMLNERAKR